MKKIISILLATIIASSGTVFAQDKTQKVLESVKGRIGDTSAYGEFYSNKTEQNNTVLYDFFWEDHENSQFLSLSATPDGIITYYIYNSYKNEPKKTSLIRMDYEDARKKAEDLCNTLNPSLAGIYMVESTGMSENLSSDYFIFDLQRYENGIPVTGDSGNVRITLDGTKILSYHITYSEDYTFESNQNMIDSETAKKAFAEKIGFNPIYRIIHNYKDKTISTEIVFEQNNYENTYISATTGEVIHPVSDRNEIYRNENNALKDSVTESISALSDAEMSRLEQLGTLMTKDEVIAVVKNNKYINLTDNYKFDTYKTSINNITGEYFAYLTYYDKETYYTLEICVDMQTGEIISFYKDGKKAPGIDTATAEEVIKYFASDKAAEFKPTDDPTVWVRYVNGLKCPDNTITLGITENNEVYFYNILYTDVEFAPADNVITSYAALKILHQNNEYKPYYVLDKDKNFKLVYNFSKIFIQIDALTGDVENADKPQVIEYSDISGHWAEDKINTLARFGIGFLEDSFSPDKTITQKEFAVLVNSVFGNCMPLSKSTDFTYAYDLLKSYNIITDDEISPDEPTTREDAAIILVKCMGADKFAKVDEIFNCPFEDVTENKGYISILWAMNVISGNPDKTFCPKNTITRAEAAVMIYNYIENVGI